MISEGTMKNIKLFFSLLLAVVIAYALYNYFDVEPWYYAAIAGLVFGILFYLLVTERKAPTGAVTVARYIVMLLIAGYFGYSWYQRTGNIEESVGVGIITLIAAYILIIRGFKKGGEG
ncbi:DUF2955 domain-containing protein [Candidatus Micrarchaeota archaeon]|nr:DUF2955 domain-containing protein [Candidatus Micrarchaeota archaeon]